MYEALHFCLPTGPDDYVLQSFLLRVFPSRNERVFFRLQDDNIAAEGEETLELELTLLSTPTENGFFLNRLSITIEDVHCEFD